MEYSRRGFLSRHENRGLTSEACFRWWTKENDVVSLKTGFDDPPFKYFPSLPRTIRQTPDVLCEDQGNVLATYPQRLRKKHFYVEVKSVGKDGTLKVKDENIDSMLKWQKFGERPLFLFVYDSHTRRHSKLIPLDEMIKMPFTADVFPVERGTAKSYRGLPVDSFKWVSVPEKIRYEGEPGYDPTLDPETEETTRRGWVFLP